MSDSISVIHADSREALRDIPDASVDSCVCDPPYALVSIVKRYGSANAAPAKDRDGLYKRAAAGFMGKQWDTGDTAFDPAFWVEVLRVLKPGAHLIAFGGTRTYHRLVCAIEDAGFEVRDQLAWLFGSGFPKSHDVSKGIDRAAGAEREVVGEIPDRWTGAGSVLNFATDRAQETVRVTGAPATDAAKQWQGWGTALKPAHEPICLARKPLIGTVAANVLQHGTGALNIDASRIESEPRETTPSGMDRLNAANAAQGYRPATYQKGTPAAPDPSLGRWPANVLHDGSEEVLRHFPETESGAMKRDVGAYAGENVTGFLRGRSGPDNQHGDAGSAARFFYTAKADTEDRVSTCAECGARFVARRPDCGCRDASGQPAKTRGHPTVKPVDLMAYLVKLVTPPGGLVLDPFAGSGTTGMACMREGFRAVLIEREAEYVEDIKRRLAHVKGEDAPLFAGLSA